MSSNELSLIQLLLMGGLGSIVGYFSRIVNKLEDRQDEINLKNLPVLYYNIYSFIEEVKIFCDVAQCNASQLQLFKKRIKKINDALSVQIFSGTMLLSAEQHIQQYLFSWNKIPGNDEEKLKESLNQNYDIDWVKTAKIEKHENGKTIEVFTEENKLYLELNDEKTKVNLRIDDNRTDEFVVKAKNGKLNICMQQKLIDFYIHLKEFIAVLGQTEDKDETAIGLQTAFKTGMTYRGIKLTKLLKDANDFNEKIKSELENYKSISYYQLILIFTLGVIVAAIEYFK